MKGIVFTEFLELVEQKFGLGMVDTIIEESELESNGVYTSVGTYSFTEMLQLLTNLNKHTGIAIDDLLELYAEHFFEVIKRSYGQFLVMYTNPIEMLASIESHIHREVRKIYPDAELPEFEIVEKTNNTLVMIYKSGRAMHHFGLGLMRKTFDHFNAEATIVAERIKEDGTEVKFVIEQH